MTDRMFKHHQRLAAPRNEGKNPLTPSQNSRKELRRVFHSHPRSQSPMTRLCAIAIALFSTFSFAQGLSLEELITKAESAENLRSIALSLEGLDAEIESRDFELIPRLD